ncbi:MAG: M1 family metallopeptidase [Deltaproteobacteria bacterium]|nr:M1 family metallopeptidase [Deltaproteobacteria bacterium]
MTKRFLPETDDEGTVGTTIMMLLTFAGATGHGTRAPAKTALPKGLDKNGRLVGSATPVAYDLALTIDPREARFSGRTRISVRVARATREITLHARAMTVTAASAKVGKKVVPASTTAAYAPGELEEPSLVTLAFAEPLPRGLAVLELAYNAPFDTKLSGLYRVKDGAEWYAFTQFEANDARRAFPCFDEPAFKVPFAISLTVPKGQLAFANNIEKARSDSADGKWTTVTFTKSEPLPTYLVAFAVGPLDVRDGEQVGKIPVRLIATKGKAALGAIALDATVALLKGLIAYFGSPYPYKKLDIVAVPEFAAGAMENSGLITFREELVLLDPKQTGEQAMRRAASVIAHELAHQWFGNWVTMKWWNDLWLNEAFATWITSKIVDSWKPAYRLAMEDIVDKGHAMATDALAAARKIRQPVLNGSDAEEAFDAITYEKGAAVLGMVESWVGEAAFRNGVRAYLKKHAWGNATAEDLLGALSKAAKKDVVAVAESFIDQSGVPLVNIEPICDKRGVKLKVRQARYHALGAGEPREKRSGSKRWAVPVCARLEGAESSAGHTVCGVASHETSTLEVKGAACPVAVVPNVGEKGYYRYSLPAEWMQKLVGARLSAAERLGVVMNAAALLKSGALNSDDFFNLLQGFSGDQDRFVVDAVVGGLRLADVALVDDASRAGYRELVRRTLGPVLARLGVRAPTAPEDADTKLLRRTVFAALGSLAESREVLDEAERVADLYLADRTSVDPDLAIAAANLASRRGGDARFDGWVKLIEGSENPQQRQVALYGLGGFSEKGLAARALDFALTDSVKKQDTFYIPSIMFSHYTTRDLAYQWLKDNFEKLKKRIPESHIGRLYGGFGVFASPDRRKDAEKFFGAPERKLEGGERRLAEGLELLDLSIALHRREGERARRYLTSLTPQGAPVKRVSEAEKRSAN